MVKKAVLFGLLFVCYLSSTAQSYDRNWLIGSVVMVQLKFDSAVPIIDSFYPNELTVPTSGASSNVSDTNGNLLFYCNGVTVANSLGKVMENGDTLTDTIFYNLFAGGFTEGQSNIILPKSGNTFYLFYCSESDSLLENTTIEEADRLYYAVIDMNANGGLGKVISKKNVAYKGILGDNRITACRHANGRDWWLVHQGYADDEYFVYLVTPDSVYLPVIQQIGASDFYDDNLGAQSVFSPDGSKFATISAVGPLEIMDFDRCSGVFSQPDSIVIPKDTFYYNGNASGSLNGGSAACFSESGRFLYINNNIYIYQYDTWATNVMASGTIIGEWDSVGTPGGDLAFNQMYLLPNGQILIEDLQGAGSNFHLIDSPDVQGAGCHFVLNGLPTSTLNAIDIPNMINYRLGALPGSGCDTLGISPVASGENEMFKFLPIPASENLTLVCKATADFTVRIYTVTGQKMGDLYMSADNTSQYINIDSYSTGVYYYEIVRDNSTLQRGNLSIVKEE